MPIGSMAQARQVMATGAQGGDETHGESSWPVTFPGNLRWSNAMQIVKGMAPYGAIAMDEVDRITRRLKARAGESDPDLCLLYTSPSPRDS